MTMSNYRNKKKVGYKAFEDFSPLAGISATIIAAIYASAIIMIIAAIIMGIAAFVKIWSSKHK